MLSWRAEDRERCWGTVPPTVDEVLDLILSASRGEAPGEDGISTVLGAGGRPMAMLLQPLFAGVWQTALSIVWEGSIMATIPSGKNKRAVMLNDQVGKILGWWIRPKLQIEPPLDALAAGVFVDVARIRGLWAAAVFCDLAAACCSVVRQYVVGTDLPSVWMVRPRSRACLMVVARVSRLLIWSSSSCLARCSRRCAIC